MKLNKIIYSITLSILMLTGSSCNKWLELKPLDGIIRQEFWQTKEDIRAAVNGIYSSLVAGPSGTSEKMAETLFIWGELRADMVTGAPSVTAEQTQFLELNVVPSNSLVKWSIFYRTINFCNTVLEFAPGVKALDPTLTDAQLNVYLGEALAIRSLMNFYLLRTFGDIPLKLKASAKDEDLEEIGKTAQKDVIAQIITDLKLAESYVPVSYNGLMSIDKGRIIKTTVNTILADVYLWNEQNAECILECDKVMAYAAANPTRMGLIPVAGTSNWGSTVFTSGSSKETIFEFSMSGNISGNPFYPLLIPDGSKRLNATAYVADNIFPVDILDPQNVVDVRANAYYNAANSVITKYGTNNPSLSNWQAYRYSDVMMIKAEAHAASGQGAAAMALINELRVARNALSTTLETPADIDSDAILNYILNERSREFAFEGKRWYDLLRFAKRKNYDKIHILLDMVARTVNPTLQQAAINKLRDHNSHYLPINEADIFADSKLVQNPFYNK